MKQPESLLQGRFCAEIHCFTEMSHGRVRKMPVTGSCAWFQECCAACWGERYAVFLHGAQHLNWHLAFHPAFTPYWEPDLPSLNLVPVRISPEFSNPSVNTMQISSSALTRKQYKLFHTGILFWFSLCIGPGRAGSWIITGSHNQFSSLEDKFLESNTNAAELQNGFEVMQVYTGLSYSNNVW